MGIFKRFKPREVQLELKKVHDYCASKTPVVTVVFVHGIATDASCFTNTIKYLEGTASLKNVRFVAFDLLGSGKSYTSDDLNYDFHDQITALHNSINNLHLDTPLVLVGHSMGALITIRYADTYKKSCKHLILVSPPVYRPEDIENPKFMIGIKLFKDAVSINNHKILKEKSFNNSIDKIVLNKYNYGRFINLKTHATIIYGEMDRFIGAKNIPHILKENSKYLVAIKTAGRHGMSKDKYSKMVGVLEDIINDVS
ncbi:alpha/beta fold hydrolase [Candidatus Saccharibacteria bacterium]|nr:alpha/beta fold hydrolase [Candidatus Saccharibacteria bacterium]